MPSIKDLFKTKGGADTATILELEHQAADLALELNDAAVHADQTFLDAATDPAAKPEADRAANDVRQTRERLDRVNGALVAAAARQEENDLAAQEATEEAAWRKAQKLARARQDVGVEINVLILKLADYWIKLLQLGEELYKAAPVRGAKLHNSPMAPANVEKALRLYLLKNSFKTGNTGQASLSPAARWLSSSLISRPSYSSTSPRARIHAARSRGRPAVTSVRTSSSV